MTNPIKDNVFDVTDKSYIAALRYYESPTVKSAMQDWWNGLAVAFRRQGIQGVPGKLFMEGGFNEGIGRPNLLFGQTCGYPFTHEFRGKLNVIATPIYDAPHSNGPEYSSVILANKHSGIVTLEDAEGKCVAVSNRDSFSGYIALQSVFLPFAGDSPFFDSILITVSQWNSLLAVADGRADIFACDCISYELARLANSELVEQLRFIGTSPYAPGLPYVINKNVSPDLICRLRKGLFEALEDASLASVRKELLISGASCTTNDDYQTIIDLVSMLRKNESSKLFPDSS